MTEEENILLRKQVERMNQVITHLLDKITQQEKLISAYAAAANGIIIHPAYIVSQNDGTKNSLGDTPPQKEGAKKVLDDTPPGRDGIKHNLDEVPLQNDGIKHVFYAMPAQRDGTKQVFDATPPVQDGTKHMFYHIPADGDGIKQLPDAMPPAGDGTKQVFTGSQTRRDTITPKPDEVASPAAATKQDSNISQNDSHNAKQVVDNSVTQAVAATTIDMCALHNKLTDLMKYASPDCITNTANILLALHKAPAVSVKNLRAGTSLSVEGMAKRMMAMKKAGFIIRLGPPKQYLLTQYAKQLIEAARTGGSDR